ncbi:trypsin-like serine protease [Rhizobium laguerreae]|uniref:trypsin-like serine protease n=1 Tax=Rhizobium laguerreae TaxID=1076926 RepID=UPI001C91DF1E|nr:trypsin-like serine protease [Rhizobium laguerreae]MBY3158340.1 trypsin-like serine protease [Rhizobium laguerreae]
MSPETKFSSGIVHIQLGGNFCSGSVVAKRKVLTAEHCFRNRGGSGLPVTFFSKAGRTVILSQDVAMYPRPDSDKCCDLAVLTLSEDAPAGTTIFGFSDELYRRYQKYVAQAKVMGDNWKAAAKFTDLLDHTPWPDPIMKTEAILFETYGRGSYGVYVGPAVNGGLKSCSLKNPDKSLVVKKNNTGFFGMHLPWVWSLRTSAACAGNSGGPSFFLRKGKPYEEKGKIIVAGVNSVGLGPASVYSEPGYRWLKSQGI